MPGWERQESDEPENDLTGVNSKIKNLVLTNRDTASTIYNYSQVIKDTK